MCLRHPKCDAPAGDPTALAPFPLIVTRHAWDELRRCAAALAEETTGFEQELTRRADLRERLGLPARLAEVFAAVSPTSTPPAASRIMRFDFHLSTEGWRVSEVNSDVPGGFTESSRFAALMARATGAGRVPGDAVAAWTDAIARSASGDGPVALLFAPGWVEDVQVVAHVASRLEARGVQSFLSSAYNLKWIDRRAALCVGARTVPLGAVLRFYQAEWVAGLRWREAWLPLFVGGRTPVSNPGCAILSESKRAPLTWPDLDSSTETWRRVTPEARDPRDVPRRRSGDWVIKPAFGHTRGASARPSRWIAQRRFASVPIESPIGPVHACVGVYVVDGCVAGAYGRLSKTPVIDARAIDVATLVEGPAG